MVAALENSVQRFARHRRREVLEAFLRLVYRDNVTLKQMLENPHHAAFVALVEILSRSPHGSIIGLVTSFLDDPQAPSAALSVAAKRTDCKFVQHLLRKFGREPSAIVAQNLKRMDAIAWVRSGGELLDQLDESAQHAAIRMIMASAASRTHALPLVEHLLLHGKPEGRRAAAESLAAFHGAEANQLALRALDDKDPEIQARILSQLRGRGIPGALPRLLEALDSPYPQVRSSAQGNLAEFTFQRFLNAFELLTHETRRSTGRW